MEAQKTQRKEETQLTRRFVDVGQERERIQITQRSNQFFSIWIETKGVYMYITQDDVTIYMVQGGLHIGTKGKSGKHLIPNKIKRF